MFGDNGGESERREAHTESGDACSPQLCDIRYTLHYWNVVGSVPCHHMNQYNVIKCVLLSVI